MSNVGKSIIVAGLCRIFAQDGYKVAPFKSQNMSLNSFITNKGLEMGRAQVVQAEACGIPPDVRMNPILLKPNSETGCQVVVEGKVLGQTSAIAYREEKKTLKSSVLSSFQSLAEEFDLIVIEGAGSPAEINLNQDDFVNMGLAEMVDSPVILVGDIDRGGIFATLYGTIKLLDEKDQKRIIGVIINKFRGDLSLLQPGLEQLECLIERPVLGTVPFLSLDIEEEDSLSPSIESKNYQNSPSKMGKNNFKTTLDIGVIRLPKMSNFTDFSPLTCYDNVTVRYITTTADFGAPDLIILPGSKNTMADLTWLKQSGLADKVMKNVKINTPFLGICGGFQMLCKELSDPFQVENGGKINGLGLIPLTTIFEKTKTTTQVSGIVQPLLGIFSPLSGCGFTGYEIHMGTTHFDENSTETPCFFSSLLDENSIQTEKKNKMDGWNSANILGTYVHGIFEEGDFCSRFLSLLLENKTGIKQDIIPQSYQKHKENQYNSLADALRKSLDLNTIYQILEEQEVEK